MWQMFLGGLCRTFIDVLRGRCLCEEILFEMEPSHDYGRGRAIGVCQCTRCQRWSGAPNLPVVAAAPERFRVVHGLEQMAHYRDEASTMRAFCRRCGAGLYQEIGATYYVSGGVLCDLTLRPAFELLLAE